MGSAFCKQARNQEFFRAGELSWNLGILININLQYKKEKPHREKISDFFCLETIKNSILNENFTHRCPKSGHFFSKLAQFYPIFEKGQGRLPPPPPPSSYAHNLIQFEGVDLFYRNVQFGCILALKCW